MADDDTEPEYIAPAETGSDSLGTFGEASDEELEELDAPPIPFTLVGYERKADPKGKHARREFEFHVLPTQSFGPLFNMLQHTDSRGNIPINAAVQFIGDALTGEDRDRWSQTLRDPDIEFRGEALGEMAQALAERYGLRPSAPRRERRATSRRVGKTTGAGRASLASKSKPSTRRTA
jgi:hypothetical protein